MIQSDFAIIAGWELCMMHGQIPQQFLAEAYQIHFQLMLAYLNKLEKADEKPYFDPKHAIKRIKESEEKWIKYDKIVIKNKKIK